MAALPLALPGFAYRTHRLVLTHAAASAAPTAKLSSGSAVTCEASGVQRWHIIDADRIPIGEAELIVAYIVQSLGSDRPGCAADPTTADTSPLCSDKLSPASEREVVTAALHIFIELIPKTRSAVLANYFFENYEGAIAAVDEFH